jgi:hypothetical protein
LLPSGRLISVALIAKKVVAGFWSAFQKLLSPFQRVLVQAEMDEHVWQVIYLGGKLRQTCNDPDRQEGALSREMIKANNGFRKKIAASIPSEKR